MKRIGVIVDNDLNSDVRVLREIRLLQTLGFSISVLCFAFKGKTYDKIEDVEVVRIPITKKKKNRLYFFYHMSASYKRLWIKHISSFIKKTRPDVIHVHDLYMSEATKNGIQKSGIKIPFVLDLHENYPAAVQTYSWTKGFLRSKLSKVQRWQNLEESYLRYADRLIVLSSKFRSDLLAKYDFLKEKEVGVIPNVIDLETFKNADFNIPKRIKKLRNGKNVVFFYFGVIAKRRGIFEVIKAFPDLIKAVPHCKLLLVGPVDKANKLEFEELSSGLIQQGDLIYEKWINLKDLPSFMANTDIGLAPFEKNEQHESGIANKIYQYMYGKLPIIASNCKPQQDLIEKENFGLIFRDNTELLNQMKKLASNKEFREKLGVNGYNSMIKQYNIEAYKEEMMKIFTFKV
jgi:glycosyltransferase involved in cell wall biosynthesis